MEAIYIFYPLKDINQIFIYLSLGRENGELLTYNKNEDSVSLITDKEYKKVDVDIIKRNNLPAKIVSSYFVKEILNEIKKARSKDLEELPKKVSSKIKQILKI
jgi:hypothetical protein